MKNEKVKDEENKEITKPLEVAIEDSRKAITQAVVNIANENGLSYYFLEIIIGDLHNELIQQSKLQIENLRENYNKLEKKEKENLNNEID